MTVYDRIISLLIQHGVKYKEYAHSPIYSYEDAARECFTHNWSGTESKSVLLTDKKGNYLILATIAGKKVDFWLMKTLTGMKLSLASVEEVVSIANCTPWNIPAFGLPIKELSTFVDNDIFIQEWYLFSPWVPNRTIELDPKDLLAIFQEVNARFF